MLRILVSTVDEVGINLVNIHSVEGSCIIGREQADIVVRDSRCSRQQAIIYFKGMDQLWTRDQLWIQDLSSRNGTRVNGKEITQCRLVVGDEIQIGNVRLFVLDFRRDPALLDHDTEATERFGEPAH